MESFPGAGLRARLGDAGAGDARPGPGRLPRPEKLIGRHRRAIGEWVLHVPHTFRALVRADEIWLVILAAIVGLAAGLSVTAMTFVTQAMHRVLFDLDAYARLSGQVEVAPWRAIVVPTVGGLLLGVAGLGIARWWPRRAIDPIEANALYGGRMSLNDSLIVVGQTMLSNGVRRLGRPGGGVCADRFGAGLPARPVVPAAAERPAPAGRLRRRRRRSPRRSTPR